MKSKKIPTIVITVVSLCGLAIVALAAQDRFTHFHGLPRR